MKTSFIDFYSENNILPVSQDISDLKKAPNTSEAIGESLYWLDSGAPIDAELKHLPEWWGRGQQYASFIKK